MQDLGGVPDAYQSNWLGANTFNRFRSGDVGQLPSEYADLQAEIIGVCEDECSNGTFFMAARVRNAGTIDAPAGLPVTVRAGLGGPIVVTLETLEPVPAGKTGEVLFFELPAAGRGRTKAVRGEAANAELHVRRPRTHGSQRCHGSETSCAASGCSQSPRAHLYGKLWTIARDGGYTFNWASTCNTQTSKETR